MFKAVCLALALAFVSGFSAQAQRVREPVVQSVIYHADGGDMPCDGVFSPGTTLSDNILDLTCYYVAPLPPLHVSRVHYGQTVGYWEY